MMNNNCQGYDLSMESLLLHCNIEQENCLFSLCIDLSRDHISSIEMSPSTSLRFFTHPTGSDLDNAQDLIEINLTKDNCFY